MNLISLNLQRPSSISSSVYGNFSAAKSQEIVAIKGTNAIELLRPDDTGKLISIVYTQLFSIVRSLLPFRLAGSNRDYLIVGTDSGKISILEFDISRNDWKLLHCEVFGRSGCRRVVPGQYLAADPKGRAILIGAVEKQRFVYVMNRDSNNKLTISSPLEAHRSETITFHICGVDVGFDNPIFAMIELEYTDADQDSTGVAASEADKKLTFYELDLGLNHVVRKWSEPISRTANFLLTVPGGDNGPSGVLICGENWVSYKNQNHPEIRAALPRRSNMPNERGLLIISGTVHKQKDMFFFMIQTELGDLYKVTLILNETDKKIVENIVVSVFDTIAPANSLCITKTGLLFAASEFSNHYLFQFQGIGDNSNVIQSKKIEDDLLNEELGDDSLSASKVAPLFAAASNLSNLLITDEINSLAPITDMIIDDVCNEESKQIYTLCGKGYRSKLRVLRHGIAVTEMAVSELPGRPLATWTIKQSFDSDVDKYIVVSFSNSTLVLGVGETVEEVSDSGFLTNVASLQVALLCDNSYLQIYSKGIRHIRPDTRISEWETPGRRPIEKVSANSRQVVISLSGGEIIYFELDSVGQLLENGNIELGKEVTSLDVGMIPPGRIKSPFLAVGCADETVQVLSLDSSDLLTQRSAMSVLARPDSVSFVLINKEDSNSNSGTSKSVPSILYLNVGLSNGVVIRVTVDSVAGSLSDSRQRFLGPKSVKLVRIQLQGQPALLALSSRPWIMYNYQGRYIQSQLTYDMLESAAGFSSDICTDGIVAVAANTLRIIVIENLGQLFNQTSFNLRYTPRKIVRFPNSKDFVIIESDHNELSEIDKARANAIASSKITKSSNVDDMDMSDDNGPNTNENEVEGTFMPISGPLPPKEGVWGSCIRIIEATGATKSILELSNNEAAMSLCICRFSQVSEEAFVIVGVVKDLSLHPKLFSACFIRIFRVIDGTLQFLHETEVEDIPIGMIEFQGRLLVGIGKSLRLYDLGKKKLLKKAENRLFPTSIVRIVCNGDRIYVGDLAESVHFVRYKRLENTLSIFADDTLPRFVTSIVSLDYNTIALGDKFGNISVLRLPENVHDDLELGGGNTSRLSWDQSLLNGAPNKVQALTNYYLGEMVTSLTKTTFIIGGTEVIVASTVNGGLYALIPFNSKEDVSFFQHLEMFMRQESENLCQRDHMSYRSYYQPVKDTIDGDLCEKFASISYEKQKELAEAIDRTPAEIIKKLEDLRNIL